jgi:predicted kinase
MTLDSFYKSDKWTKLISGLKLERLDAEGNLICDYCGKPITKAYDCIGHHKIELTEDNVNDFSISLNPDNISLIHFKCHNKIHQRFEGFRQNVYLVYGSPCAGKTTWVRENANDDDLILDIDSLWTAICKADRYHKPNRLKKNVFGIRDCIIDQIRTRTGNWRNAYVIGGYALRTERDRLINLLGATPIYIESTKEECLSRANTEEWKEYIADWWDSYTE